MINITRLLCGQATPGDSLRYSDASHQRPVVVWNVTRSCNLHCLHCYANAAASPDPAELSTTEGKALIDDLAQYRVPVVLFSGGVASWAAAK
ncbi:MAG: radical SAM protein, partial [Chloroflexota bacterium]